MRISTQAAREVAANATTDGHDTDREQNTGLLACALRSPLPQTGDDINREGENYSVECERQNSVKKRQITQLAGSDLHIRDLTGHTNDKREISEIAVVRRILSWKQQAASVFVTAGLAVAIKLVSVAQSEDAVHEKP